MVSTTQSVVDQLRHQHLPVLYDKQGYKLVQSDSISECSKLFHEYLNGPNQSL